MQDSKHFFKVDIEAVKEGIFYKWSKAEYALWIVLKAHEDYQEHTCYPCYETIRRLTGLSPTQIKTAIDKLTERGFITPMSGYKRRTGSYYIMEK